jgi:hypothetical protein
MSVWSAAANSHRDDEHSGGNPGDDNTQDGIDEYQAANGVAILGR